jgi:hypothetical protein
LPSKRLKESQGQCIRPAQNLRRCDVYSSADSAPQRRAPSPRQQRNDLKSAEQQLVFGGVNPRALGAGRARDAYGDDVRSSIEQKATPPTESISVHGLGHVLKLFYSDFGPLGDLLLVVLAVGSMWLGFRYSRPSNILLSIRRPPED